MLSEAPGVGPMVFSLAGWCIQMDVSAGGGASILMVLTMAFVSLAMVLSSSKD